MGGFTNASEQQSGPCNHGEVSDLYACNDERTNEQTADNFELVHCNNTEEKEGGSTFEANRKSWGRDRGHLNMWRETQIKRERKMKKKCFVGMSNCLSLSLSLFLSFNPSANSTKKIDSSSWANYRTGSGESSLLSF